MAFARRAASYIFLVCLAASKYGHARKRARVRAGVPEPKRFGIEIVDKDYVGFHAFGKWPKKRNSSTFYRRACCAQNYSALWDISGELLAIAVDGVLCPDEIQRHRDIALHKSLWDDEDHTYWRLENGGQRQFHANGTGLPANRYKGAFPGTTGRATNFDEKHYVQDAIAACVGEFTVHLAMLKSRPLRSLRRQKRLPLRPKVEAARLSNGGLFPNYFGGFFASICVQPADLHWYQSCPHTDSVDYGIASVLTLTKDPRYQRSGTAVTRNRHAGISIIRSNADREAFDSYVRRNGGSYQQQGYMNGTGNHFASIIAKLPNKFNRISLYLRNRLHTTYFDQANDGDTSLLHCDPRKGRLTSNMFFELFAPDDKTCQERSRGGGSRLTEPLASSAAMPKLSG